MSGHGALHVIPINDLVEHSFHDCICGPTDEPVDSEDGDGIINWFVVHHSLDGRELHETAE